VFAVSLKKNYSGDELTSNKILFWSHVRAYIFNWPITDEPTVFEIRLSNLLAQKLQNYNIYKNVYRFYWKKLAKVTGPNQFSLAVGHRTSAKVDDWAYFVKLSTFQ
jgi:hypothetical protein